MIQIKSDTKSSPLLEAFDLSVGYRIPAASPFGKAATLRAVENVSFQLYPGECLGVVGESGCGKSSLARVVTGLQIPSSGALLYQGQTLTGKSRKLRNEIQLIFQDPTASLNPRMTISQIVAEPFRQLRADISSATRPTEVRSLLNTVGLGEAQINRYPHELSGGQCQRVGIARALAAKPQLLVCDEAVSALDVSIQAQVINLLKTLKSQLALTLLFIAHDLAVVRHISDRVLVMYMGRIVEEATRDALFTAPKHPYTATLLAAAPRIRPTEITRSVEMAGEPPSPLNPPQGCAFRSRCPRARDRCAQEIPALHDIAAQHRVACHFPITY